MHTTDTLALLGGQPAIANIAPHPALLGEADVAAAAEVIRGGVLSGYIGASGDAFMGGPRVRAFETQCAAHFGVKHALAVNSWTSGLVCAVGAIGIEPGDEVITTPWTMTATATAVLHWAGVPVFADIDRATYNISPASVLKLIGPRTKAVIAVDIFGQSADMTALRDICDHYDLKLLGDCAQAPGALHRGQPAGTLADIGGYSLNYHKHIHCGEGGVLVTNHERYARRLALIRNHAEAVVQSDVPAELANLLGHNFRLGEIEAAIAATQLPQLQARVGMRQQAAAALNAGLAGLPGLSTPAVLAGNTHVYYIYGLQIDTVRLGVSREQLLQALRADGVPGLVGSYQNLHLLPLYKHRIAYGTGGFPWKGTPHGDSSVTYGPGLCPVAEDLHSRSFFGLALGQFAHGAQEVAQIVAAFKKVWANLHTLRPVVAAAALQASSQPSAVPA